MATVRQKKAIKAHFCDCEFCELRSKCSICGIDNGLQRAHIVPQYLIRDIIEDGIDKAEWLSFDGSNIFALCKTHHRQYDSFSLSNEDIEKIRGIVDKKLCEFIQFVEDKSVREKKLIRFDRWAERTNKFLFGGGDVISFTYICQKKLV